MHFDNKMTTRQWYPNEVILTRPNIPIYIYIYTFYREENSERIIYLYQYRIAADGNIDINYSSTNPKVALKLNHRSVIGISKQIVTVQAGAVKNLEENF